MLIEPYLTLDLSNMYWVHDLGVIVDAESPDHMSSVLLIFLLVFHLTLKTIPVSQWPEICQENNPNIPFTYITSDVSVSTGCKDWNCISFHLKFLCFCFFPFKLVTCLWTRNRKPFQWIQNSVLWSGFSSI